MWCWQSDQTFPNSVGSSGLSNGSLFYLPSALWTVPEGSGGLPPSYGECFIFSFHVLLHVQHQSLLQQHLNSAHWSVLNDQSFIMYLAAFMHTEFVVGVLEGCPYYTLSLRLITEPLFLLSQLRVERSAGLSKERQRCVWWITDYYCDQHWLSDLFFFLLTWDNCDPFVFCSAYTALSIGYPKTLLGLQSRHNCKPLIRLMNHMVRTW